MLMLGNLRGIRESGRIFAVPTYFFIVSMLAADWRRGWRCVTGTHRSPCRRRNRCRPARWACSRTFALLTAFSNGCTAMTGVEAVSNGVPAFRPPESRNAAQHARRHGDAGDRDVRRASRCSRTRTGSCRTRRETVVSQIARGDVRRPRSPVLPGAGRHDADPGARGQHGLRGFPAARLDRRARSFSAASVHESGRSAGVLERHPRSSACSPARCSSSSTATRTRSSRST